MLSTYFVSSIPYFPLKKQTTLKCIFLSTESKFTFCVQWKIVHYEGNKVKSKLLVVFCFFFFYFLASKCEILCWVAEKLKGKNQIRSNPFCQMHDKLAAKCAEHLQYFLKGSKQR